MKPIFNVFLLLCIIGLACSTQSYQGIIQTAIVQTQTSLPTSTWTSSPTIPPTATKQPTATITPTTEAKAQSESGSAEPSPEMKAFLDKLTTENVINSSEGTFYKIKDFNQSLNKIGIEGLFLAPSGYSPKYFILRTDVSWSTDGGQATDWALCAPLIAFHQTDKNFYLYTFAIGSGSPVNLLRFSNNIPTRLNRGSPANLAAPDGNAKVAIVLFNNAIRLYINDKLVDTANYSGFATASEKPGTLSLGMMSGNSTGYGFRVKMTNIELWEIKNNNQ